MNNSPGQLPFGAFGALVVISSISIVQAAENADYVTDIIFALDVSASMQTDNNFGKVRDRLIEFVRDELDLETNVAVITFGEDARLVAQATIKGETDRTALIAKLQQMKADSKATYMAAGIDLSLQHLQSLRQQHPDRAGMLIMLTDGKNQPPSSVPADKQVTFAKLREKYTGQANFQAGKEWFFWYCFIGNADEDVRAFAESMQGESKPVTGPWKFLKVRFNRALVKLPDVTPGNWAVEYPAAADREQGDAIVVSTRNPGEYDLQISNILLDNPGPEERVFVSPRSLRMNQAEQKVVLQFTGQNVQPGERRGRILFRAPGKLVFVQPPQLRVSFRVIAPMVLVVPAEAIKFGRLLPGESLEQTIQFIPNEQASRSAAGKSIRLVLPADLPQGVQMTAEPAAVPLTQRSSVRLKFAAAAGATLPAEGYHGKVTFAPIEGLRFEPSSVPVSLEASQPAVDVTPPDQIDFGTLAPGGQAVRQVYLTPNQAAAAAGVRVVLAGEGELPRGVELRVEPAEAILKEKTAVRLTLKLASDAGAVGDLRGAILVKASDRNTAVSSPRVLWNAAAAAAVVDVTPGDKLDFGLLEAGTKQTRSVWLAPIGAAAALKPKVRLSAETVAPGAEVAFDPQEIVVDNKKEIKVTLKAGTAAGPQQTKIVLQREPESVQLAVSELLAAYEGVTGGITIDARELVYRDVLPGDATAEVRVRVVASSGAIGETVRLEWSDLANLPTGMTVTPVKEQVTIGQSAEDVVLGLQVRGGVAGEYQGTVRPAAKSKVTPSELPVRLEIVPRKIEVVDAPDEWLVKIWPWGTSGDYELPLSLRPNKAASGAKLSVRAPEAQPSGIRIELQPNPVQLQGEPTRAGLVARIDLSPGVFSQTYTGSVKLVADLAQTEVVPSEIRWHIHVAPLWPWLVVAFALLAWIVLRVIPRRLDAACTLKLEAAPPSAIVEFRGEAKPVGQSLRIGMPPTYGICLGPYPQDLSGKAKRERMPDVTIKKDAAITEEYVRIYRRGKKHKMEIKTRSRRRKYVLHDGDEIRLGSTQFIFRCPSCPPRKKSDLRHR